MPTTSSRPANALAFVPDDLSDVDAAPLLCAGITTYNSLRNSGARPGDTVAILGIGGLGHLGVQYAAKSGYRTVAIARGADKGPLAKQLGAHIYIDSTTQDPASRIAETRRRRGHSFHRSPAPTHSPPRSAASLPPASSSSSALPDKPFDVNGLSLISGRRSIVGWPSGTGMDSEDTLNFSALTGIKPMIETYPLEQAEEAYNRMMSGKARFRVVITTDNIIGHRQIIGRRKIAAGAPS